MIQLILCRERLHRIQRILGSFDGKPVTLRDFTRRYNVWKWEVEQAAEMRWVEITVLKPPTGRPSSVVRLREHRKSPPAPTVHGKNDKLPPLQFRHGIDAHGH